MSGDILLTQLVGNLFDIVVGIYVLDVPTNLYMWWRCWAIKVRLVYQGKYKLVMEQKNKVEISTIILVIGKTGYLEFWCVVVVNSF